MTLLSRIPLIAGLALSLGAVGAADAAAAAAVDDDDDDMRLVVGDMAIDVSDEEEEEEEVVEVVEVEKEHGDVMWGGLYVGTIITPYRATGPVRPEKRVTSDQARACLDPSRSKYCGNLRGADFRLTLFKAKNRGDHPRVIGYFRTGFTAGRMDFGPDSTEGGYRKGAARSLSYYTVPLFFGGNLYFLKNFPVRPYVGLGFGLDVLKMQYQRHDERPLEDTSARIGFELHTGIEARITNYVALNIEMMQLYSARRKLDGVPDFSNEGLTFLAGVTLSIPTKHKHHHHTVKRTRTVKKRRATPKPPANVPPPVAPAAPAAPAAAAPAAPAAPPAATPAAPAAAPPPPAAPVAAPAAPAAPAATPPPAAAAPTPA